MQYTHRYLVLKGKVPADREAFITLIKVISFQILEDDVLTLLNYSFLFLKESWFGLYKRTVENDSSGFEHVFCGEIKSQDGSVTGLHNW